MKILAVSDIESDLLLKYYKENHLDDIDLILSAGDLPYAYLQTVKANIQAPLFWVRGNHDRFKPKLFDKEFIEWKCVRYKGIGIAGIGCDGHNKLLSEDEMERSLGKLYRKIQRSNGADIIISHYPLRGFGDGDDKVHKGYMAINEFIKKVRPKYFIYGHNHLTYGRNDRAFQLEDTILINAYEKYVIDYN